jgi:hypothetical protein
MKIVIGVIVGLAAAVGLYFVLKPAAVTAVVNSVLPTSSTTGTTTTTGTNTMTPITNNTPLVSSIPNNTSGSVIIQNLPTTTTVGQSLGWKLMWYDTKTGQVAHAN